MKRIKLKKTHFIDDALIPGGSIIDVPDDYQLNPEQEEWDGDLPTAGRVIHSEFLPPQPVERMEPQPLLRPLGSEQVPSPDLHPVPTRTETDLGRVEPMAFGGVGDGGDNLNLVEIPPPPGERKVQIEEHVESAHPHLDPMPPPPAFGPPPEFKVDKLPSASVDKVESNVKDDKEADAKEKADREKSAKKG